MLLLKKLKSLKNLKTWQLAVSIALIVSVAFSICRFSASCAKIRGSVLRLHILANSDTESDQALKLKVRDSIIEKSAHVFDGVTSESEAIAAASENLSLLQEIAENEITTQGYDYPVKVEVGPSQFNTRVYDTVTLPAGEYMAVRVLIGEAQGKNWWCVMFPQMCLPAASETKELEEVLEEDTIDITTNSQKYEVRFKIVDVFEGFRQKVKGWF